MGAGEGAVGGTGLGAGCGSGPVKGASRLLAACSEFGDAVGVGSLRVVARSGWVKACCAGSWWSVRDAAPPLRGGVRGVAGQGVAGGPATGGRIVLLGG